jgi:hypothetical protein
VKPGDINTDKEIAERAVAQFHSRLDAQQYREIYNDADDLLRNTASEADLIASISQTHERWGKVQQTTQSGAKVLPGNPTQVRFIYNTKFEKGDATETCIWLVKDNKATLANYRNFPGTATPGTDK